MQTGPTKKTKENITEITCTAQENDKKKNSTASFASPCHNMAHPTSTEILD
jgi:hypothetical protein